LRIVNVLENLLAYTNEKPDGTDPAEYCGENICGIALDCRAMCICMYVPPMGVGFKMQVGRGVFSSLNATDAKNNQQAHSYYSATRHAKLL